MAKREYKSYDKNREAFEALTEIAGTVPPQAVELEEAVLGALMLDKDSIALFLCNLPAFILYCTFQ